MVSIKDKTYVIAELSANHGRDIETAKKSIKAAAEAGADAVKIQLFRAETLGVPDRGKSPVIEQEGSPWFGWKLYDLYKEAELPYSWLQELNQCAKENCVEFFGSVFDVEAVNISVNMGFPRIKISSFEVINIPLLHCISKTGLPVIMSTGMASETEIELALNTLRAGDCDVTLLHCVSAYPTNIQNVQIRRMTWLKQRFGVEIGLSDHSISNIPSVAAVCGGARVIEKHFVLNKSLQTLDSFFSLEPSEFASLVKDIRDTELCFREDLTAASNTCRDIEQYSFWERPSLYYSRDIQEGKTLTYEDFMVRRPTIGMSPLMLECLIGRKLSVSVERCDPVLSEHIE